MSGAPTAAPAVVPPPSLQGGTAPAPTTQGVKRSHSDMEGASPTQAATTTTTTTATTPSAPSPLVGVGGTTGTAPPMGTAVFTAVRAGPATGGSNSTTVVPPPAKKPNLGPVGGTGYAIHENQPTKTYAPANPPVAVPGTVSATNVVSMPKVQDALGYLEKVKSRFLSAPAVYNQFLDIMKDFKSQNIDTEGVIRRVKNLFKGNRSLILGFNQFLPPGYKIELEPDRRPTIEFKQAMEYVAKIKNRFREEPYIYAEFLDILHDYQAKRTIDEVYQRVQKLFHGQPDLLDEFKYFLPESAVQNRVSMASSASKPGAAKPVVKPGQPAPKPATAQPKRPATGAAAPAAKTDAKRPVPASKPANIPSSSDKSRKDAARPVVGKDPKTGKPISSGTAVGSSSGHRDGKGKDGHREHRHGHHGHSSHSHAPRVTYPPGSEKELALFERMKNHSSKAQWIQFLKALNLFANDLINRGELIRMVEDIYGERSGAPGSSDWVDKFKQTIGYDEAEEKQVAAMNQTNYYAFVSSVDFTVCHQVTPSYRELPPLIQVPHSSGRTALADEVLNDTCISIPTGSEDFSFKSTRKNIYEENLFKCEDERFELDMLIENNVAAIRVLEPLVEQIAAMPPEQAKRVRLPDTIDILHIRAIARVYAEQGYEMVELLNKSPTIATPIILSRLRQKDLEWRKIRNEMKSTWRKVNEQNYQRSLDHRSFYFKQEDKKRRSPKALVVELKEVHQAVFGTGQPAAKPEPVSASTRSAEGQTAVKKPLPFFGSEDLTGEESLMLRAIRQGQPPNPLYSYCMRFKYGDATIHNQLFDIVAKVGGLTLSSDVDQLKLLSFFAGFVAQFFGQAITSEQEQQLVRLGEKVAQEEERRGRERDEPESMFDKEKAASDALLGVPMTDGHEDEEAGGDDMEEDSDGPKPSVTLAAPAPVVQRGKPGKKKAGTKKKAATKKKVVGVAVAKASQILAPAPVKDDDDMDEDEKDDEKKEDEADESGNAARARAAQQAAQAMNQLASVRALMAKIRAANDILPDGTVPASSATPLRPVKLFLNTPWVMEEKPSPTNPPLRKHGRSSRLFLGSHAYYVFFRLHQFAYERLLTAKTLAHKARRNSSKKKLPATAQERHDRFVVILDQLLEGELETSKFEDECRNLLGASSYVLFTIDKLLEQLVKQTCQLLSTDNGLKVLSLYQYENRRVRTCIAQAKANNAGAALPTDQLSTLTRHYQSNISNLLGDDSACAIEYFDDSHELAIGLVEHLDENNRHLAGDEWNQFVDEYLSEIPAGTVRQPFRKRNVRFAARALTKILTQSLSAKEKAKIQKDGDEAKLIQQALKHTYQKYQLASKIDLRSFKLHFIEHTTDVFVRADGKSGAKRIALFKAKHKEVTKKKLARFYAWLTKRVSDLAPLAAAENAAGALGSMLGFGEGGEGEDGDAPMETDEVPADEGFGALTAAADAEDEEGEDDSGLDNDGDEKMM